MRRPRLVTCTAVATFQELTWLYGSDYGPRDYPTAYANWSRAPARRAAAPRRARARHADPATPRAAAPSSHLCPTPRRRNAQIADARSPNKQNRRERNLPVDRRRVCPPESSPRRADVARRPPPRDCRARSVDRVPCAV